MGNGPGLGKYGSKNSISIDIETRGLQDDIDSNVLTLDMLEKAAAKAMANFGAPSQIIFPASMYGAFITPFETYPEYRGTPWAFSSKLFSKREKVVAGLHTTLKKLGALRTVDDKAFEAIRYKSIMRLRLAKWAQYQQRKKYD